MLFVVYKRYMEMVFAVGKPHGNVVRCEAIPGTWQYSLFSSYIHGNVTRYKDAWHNVLRVKLHGRQCSLCQCHCTAIHEWTEHHHPPLLGCWAKDRHGNHLLERQKSL